MSKMKGQLTAMLTMAAMFNGMDNLGSMSTPNRQIIKHRKDNTAKLELADEKRRLAQGQQKFWYNRKQDFVWARTKKSADKKALKRGWI